MIRLRCPKCSKALNVADKFAGKVGACPHCKNKVHVPSLKPAKANVIEEVEDVEVVEDDDIVTDVEVDEAEEQTPRRDGIRAKKDKSEAIRPQRSRSRDDDEDDERPRQSRSRDDDEDDEDKPTRRSRSRDEDDEDDETPRRQRPKKRRKKADKREGMSPVVKALIVVGSTCAVLGLLSIFFRFMFYAPLAVGAVTVFVAQLMMLVVAFRDDVIQGLLCWFVPFYMLFYIITHFEEEKTPLMIWAGGIGFMFVGGIVCGLGAALGQSLHIYIV